MQKREKGKMKAFLEKIKSRDARLTEYMSNGRKGMMVISFLLTVALVTKIGCSYVDHLPLIAVIGMAAVATILEAGVLFLVVRVIFHSKAFGSIFEINMALCIIITASLQGVKNKPAAIILAAVTFIAVDIFGRCIWNVIKRKKYIPGYVLLALSAVWVGMAVYVLAVPGLGDNLVGRYGSAQKKAGYETSVKPEGFEEYIARGPYESASLTYGTDLDCDIKSDVFDLTYYEKPGKVWTWLYKGAFGTDFYAVPIAGKIWYPLGTSDCPVLFIVHGAHDYTVPSHLGYDYLGEYLSSHGYVVVSVDENIINLHGANSSRAILFLENIKQVFAWNDDETSIIHGLIDEANVVIAGHSRGGETVATAYLLNEYRCFPENAEVELDYHFLIKGIIAIAPTVDQYLPADRSVAISNVNYLLLHGSHDQDVTRVMGEKQYNNVSYNGLRDCFKSGVYIYGANHGQFNDEWGLHDSGMPFSLFNNENNFIGMEDQKQILKVLTKTFLDVTLKDDDTYRSLFYDIDSYSEYLPETAYSQRYESSDLQSLNNFEDNTDTKTSDDSTAVIEVNGATRWQERARSTGLDGDRENHVLEIETKEDSDCSIVIDIPVTNLETGSFSFSIADMTEKTASEDDFMEYSVEMTDINGNRVVSKTPKKIFSSWKTELYKTDSIMNEYIYKHPFSTVIIDSSEFSYNGNFDMTSVKCINLIIKDRGRTIQIDDIGLYLTEDEIL